MAAQLLRRGEPGSRVVLIERSGAFGPGVAYSSTSDAHRLNVAAAQMAPLPKDPQSFFRWSRGRDGETDPQDFLPRRLFGEYLVDLLDHCERHANGVVGLERREDEVVALTEAPDDAARRRLTLRSGTHLDVDQVVLALGNSSPAAPTGLPPEIAGSEHCLADPWESGALATARSDQTVLLLGTGLTMVDVALELGVSGGPVMYAISRSGLLPRAHQARPATAGPSVPDALAPGNLDELIALLTDEVAAAQERGEDWRPLVDSLRPVANDFWAGLDPDEQARFHHEYARLWSVHRHRMAPQVGIALHRLIEKGRLRVRSATLGAAAIREGRVDVDLSGGPGGEPGPLPRRSDHQLHRPSPRSGPDQYATRPGPRQARLGPLQRARRRLRHRPDGADPGPRRERGGRCLRDRPDARRRAVRDHSRARDRPASPGPGDGDHRQRRPSSQRSDPARHPRLAPSRQLHQNLFADGREGRSCAFATFHIELL